MSLSIRSASLEDYVRMVAVQTIGRMTLQVGRHKHALVRLLREDPCQEVRKLADLVLKQRGWQEPHWMKVQKPKWRERVIRSKANNNRGSWDEGPLVHIGVSMGLRPVF